MIAKKLSICSTSPNAERVLADFEQDQSFRKFLDLSGYLRIFFESADKDSPTSNIKHQLTGENLMKEPYFRISVLS